MFNLRLSHSWLYEKILVYKLLQLGSEWTPGARQRNIFNVPCWGLIRTDPDQRQNQMLFCKWDIKEFTRIRLFSYPADRQTDRQTQPRLVVIYDCTYELPP